MDSVEGLDEYGYDANGNMTTRLEQEVEWTQVFNTENRLASVSDGTDTWTFIYDGDGNRVKQVNPDGSVTLLLGGGIYTVEDAAGTPQVTKYYSIAGQRVAAQSSGGINYLLTDHLGSIAAVTNASGGLLSEQRYLPFGAERLTPDIGETDFGFTGQRDLAAMGLMDYNARFYDAGIGRFASADTIVPLAGEPQLLNRFIYGYSNPLKFIDPSGHIPCYDPALSCGFPTESTVTQTPVCSSLYCSLIYTANPSPSRDDPIGQNLSNTTVVVKPISISNLTSEQVDEAGKFLIHFAAPGPSGFVIYGAELFALALDLAEPYLITREENGLLILDYTYRSSTQSYDIGTLFVRNLSSHPVVVSVKAEIFNPNSVGIVPMGPRTLSLGPVGVVGSGRQEFFPLNLSVEGPTFLTISLYNKTFDSYYITVPHFVLP